QGRGAPAAPAPAPGGGVATITNGPLSMIMGPVGEVSNPTPWALSKAPTTDTYYLDIPMEEWPPDEFISNPDRETDWHNLKGWHFVPIIRTVRILGNRRVSPGQTVQFECIVEDITGTQNGCGVGYYGPHGRRTTLSVRMQPTVPGGYIMRGTLAVPPWAEPGTYRATEINAGNDTRHAKVYWADVHPSGRDLDIEVLPVPGGAALDVIPPEVEWARINMLDQPETAIRTQRVADAIPIYAKVTDNKSGVGNVRVKLMGPTTVCNAPTAGVPVSGPAAGINKDPCRYIEADLQKVAGAPDVYGAFLSIPQWWQPGEYKVYTLAARDKANKEAMLVHTTSPSLKNAKVNLTNDPANIDVTPPTFFSVWVDKTSARLGEPVTINAIIVDDKSGVGSVGVAFAPMPSFIDRITVVMKPVKPVETEGQQIRKAGLDVNSNMWTGTIQTSEWFEPGEWRVDRINARDNADNYMDILPEYHPEIDIKVTYTGGRNIRELLTNAKKGIVGNITPALAAPPGGASTTSAAGPPRITGPVTASNGVYNPVTNQITLSNGRTIDLLPGAVPDPATGRIRRIDMVPPHPPRGACLNCHEP
ncbi:MAG: hypothetical protein HY646_14935, partial [Acidobacteria bacterium]|nr:hypothetical protein [Acidobacteriota bacterium]